MSRGVAPLIALSALSFLLTGCGGQEAYKKILFPQVAQQLPGAQLTNHSQPRAMDWGRSIRGLEIKRYPHAHMGREVQFLSLAIDPLVPNTLYGGAKYHGAFKSTDGGISWNEINSGLPRPLHIDYLAIDPKVPSTVYAGTPGSGVFKTTNGGASWSAVNTGIRMTMLYVDQTMWVDGTKLPTIAVRALAIDPQNPSTVYVSIYGSGIYKSSNGGASWSEINTGPMLKKADPKYLSEQDHVSGIAIDSQVPSTIYVGTTWSGVFKSTDGGASWSDTGLMAEKFGASHAGAAYLAIDPQVPSTVYTLTYGAGAFKSTNGGASWSAVNNGLPRGLSCLAIDPQISSTVYAGSSHGVFMSTNGGASWSEVNTGMLIVPQQGVLFMAIDPQVSSTVYTGWSYPLALYKSTNGGAR